MKNIGPFFKTSIGLIKEWMHLFYGVYRVWRLPEPRVTIFGGSRFKEDNPFMAKAHELGHLLARENLSIITGGGSGIMRGVTCGATHGAPKERPNRVVGVSVRGIEENSKEVMCPQELIILDSFFTRKLLMINYSTAFVVLPGGFGTLDEFFNVLVLVQMKKLPGSPVILVGKEFWAPLLVWLQSTILVADLIINEDLKLIRITDDLKEALEWIRQHRDTVSGGKA
jgi:uncharacterized protein (TIGR00730 family)